MDLVSLGLWNDDVKNEMMKANGSIQHIDAIPDNIKELYKTVWEMSMRDIIDMSADRGQFIDQSQSLNLFVEDPNIGKLTSMHFYAWKKGLKTGMYYLRTKAATNAIKFTVSKNAKSEITPVTETEKQVKTYAETTSVSATVSEPKAKVKVEEPEAAMISITDVNEVKLSKEGKIYSAQEAISCSIDNPDDCEACGS
jgi:ribonucleoside-diphosphate reductase alpha chain